MYAKFFDIVKKYLHFFAIFVQIFAMNYVKRRKTTFNT